MLLCSQRPGHIMAHAHHIPPLIVQAHHRWLVPPALCVQRRGLFLGVSDAPSVFAVPQLKPGAYAVPVCCIQRVTLIFLIPFAILRCVSVNGVAFKAENRLVIPCLNRPAFLRLD